MRTLIIILIGIAVLLACNAAAAAFNRTRQGKPLAIPVVFVWFWLLFAIVDATIGVSTGHGLVEELAIHALIFAVPAALAWHLARRQRNMLPPGPPTQSSE